MTRQDDLDRLRANIDHTLNLTADLAEEHDTDFTDKAFLQMTWHRLDSALWCLRAISERPTEGTDQRGTPGAPYTGPWYGTPQPTTP